MIKDQAVALRLKAGSEEAGYLAQIFPLPRTPTVVLIKDGELKDYITPDTTKDDFIRRIQNAFSAPAQPTTSATAASQPAAASTDIGHAATTNAPPPSTSDSQPVAARNAEPERSDNVRRVLAERAARLQAEKEEAERKAKEERNKAKDKAKAEAEAGADTEAARSHKQAEALKKRRQQEQEERRRILKRIEDDKAERRMRAAEREQKRIDNQTGGDIAAALANAPKTKLPSTTKTSELTSLQVRLFDGSTLRSRFKTAASLKLVRAWVDENRGDGDAPYNFKQVLTPLPNKKIDETEEQQSLGDLGLSPSSTLVLVPVQSYTTAYEGAPQGILARIVGFIFGIFGWFLGLFGLGRRGGGSPEPSKDDSDSQDSGSATSSQLRERRIRGFENSQDRLRDQQLYNGNSVRKPMVPTHMFT